MSTFEQLTAARQESGRLSEYLRNSVPGERPLHLLWLYGDVLNLHGGRGDIMALLQVSELLGLPLELRRADDLEMNLPLSWADMIYLTSGELKCVPQVVAALNRQREELDDFVARGGLLAAISSSGAALARNTQLLDGRSMPGLGLLDMEWRERESVWGDDLWFTTEQGLEVIGNQIQVAEADLGGTQAPLGRLSYGHGNSNHGHEGARSGNVIFTNCLGPVLVKNPRLAAQWLLDAAAAAGVGAAQDSLRDEQITVENQSYALIRKFIEGKMK